MKWYAFNDSESSNKVNAILDHNTTAKVPWNSSGSNDQMVEAKEALIKDTKTWNSSLQPRFIDANEIAKITGKTGFDVAVSGEDNWFYFENNTQTAPSLSQGQAKYKWLFDYTNNCTENGCAISDSSTEGYWLINSSATLINRAWAVYKYGTVNDDLAEYDNCGVRPAITILKSLLS